MPSHKHLTQVNEIVGNFHKKQKKGNCFDHLHDLQMSTSGTNHFETNFKHGMRHLKKSKRTKAMKRLQVSGEGIPSVPTSAGISTVNVQVDSVHVPTPTSNVGVVSNASFMPH